MSGQRLHGSSGRRLSCVLVGKGDLVVQCGEILLARGHRIRAVASGFSRIESWAEEHRIPHVDHVKALDVDEVRRCDYLFSIINGEILPESLLGVLRGCAVNYHNSLLPRYAGVHATSWALLEGAHEHGVTWHEVTARVDGGDILLQRKFAIDPDETTLSLNLKCHVHALESFGELVEALANERIEPKAQDLSQRSYFPLHRKPEQCGLVRWSDGGEAIDRCCRALRFGQSPNDLATAKMILDGEVVVVEDLWAVTEASAEAWGTVLEVTNAGVRVATGGVDVVLARVVDLSGGRYAGEALAERFGLRPGRRLPEPPVKLGAAMATAAEELSPHERFWMHPLRYPHPAVPAPLPAPGPGSDPSREELEVEMPPSLIGRLLRALGDHGEGEVGTLLLALLLVYLQRRGSERTVTVGLRPELSVDSDLLRFRLLADRVPLSVPIGGRSFAEAVRQTSRELAACRRRQTYLRDLPLRYQGLEEIPHLHWSIVLGDTPEQGPGPERDPMDVEVVVLERPARLRFHWWNDAPGAAVTMRRTVRHLLELLRSAAEEPAAPVAALGVLTLAERHQSLVEWAAAGTALGALPAHRVFEECARRHPSRVAAVGEHAQVTYGELDRLANGLAVELRRLGVGVGHRVAVCGWRSPRLLVALLGIWKSGGAYVPLDPGHPPERLAAVLKDCAPTVLLADREATIAASGFAGPRLTLTLHGAGAEAPPAVRDLSDTVAYVMYTSGSTGRPKGVCCTHRGLTNRLAWTLDAYRMEAEERFLQVAAPAFDISVWEMVFPLAAGGTLVVAPRDRHRDLRFLVGLLRRERVSCAHFVPSLLAAILDGVEGQDRIPLRCVISGGEAVTEDLAARFHRRLTARLHHAYGPTEASISVTHWTCREGASGRPPIGRPITGCRVLLLDDRLEPVAVGTSGELFLGGVALAQGYLGRAARTADSFVPDPWGGSGERLYRTGDLAVRQGDGSLLFVGRRDDQLKVHGHRVEPGEIEAALVSRDGVREAVVMLRPGGDGTVDRLVAFVAFEDRRVPTGPQAIRLVERLREALSRRLPPHMLPTGFRFLERLPLTSNGKVNRRALARSADDDMVTAQRRLPPRTDLERQLAAAWAELLGTPPPGVRDDFFALGGHSLLVVRLLTFVRERFRAELPLRAFFERPTVEGLAASIQQARRSAGGSRVRLPGAAAGAERFRPSFVQERLWFLSRLLGVEQIYNMPVALDFRGRLDPDAMSRALAVMEERHESLRTAFGETRGELWATVLPPGRRPLRTVDLSALAGDARHRAEDLLLARVVRRPFDLGTGRLLRTLLVRREVDDHLLILAFHHAAADGWSIEALCRELGQVYSALVTGTEVDLPVPSVRYADYAVWQRRWLSGDRLQEQLDAWSERLATAPMTLDLPLDRPRPAIPSLRGGIRRQILDPASTRRLRKLDEAVGASLFMTLLASFALLLHRLGGSREVVVGTPFANRHHPGTEDVVGPFINTVALPLRVNPEASFSVLLERARAITLAAYESQDAPFDKLVDHLGVERSVDRHPLFQAMLVLNRVWGDQGYPEALEVEHRQVHPGVSLFDLTLNVEERQDDLLLEWEFAEELFDSTTVARFGEAFEHLVRDVLDDPERAQGGVQLLGAAQRQQILEWAGTATSEPTGAEPWRDFLAQAERRPDAIAVVASGRAVSYRTLAARALALRRSLRRAGAGPESVVAVLLPRSPELIATLLGIIGCGAAFLPLDVDAPAARARSLAERAGAGWLLALPGGEERLGPLPVAILRPAGDEGPGGEADRPPAGIPEAPGEAAAYVLFTSGSTGEPKGVVVTRRAMANYVLSARRHFELEPEDRVLQFASVAFDAAVEEIFPTLASGASLVLRDDRILGSAQDLLAGCQAQAVSVLDLPTGFFHRVVSDLERRPVAVPGALRLVVLGGERALLGPVAAFHRWAVASGGGVRLVNTYGPTESTVVATRCDLAAGSGEPPIGRPVTNARAEVVDRRLERVPLGVVGELCLGGLGLARGYSGRPALTAERFVPDPWGPPGARTYRSGDLACWMDDGMLRYVGRTDRQIKLRGFRVEPAEVESCLLGHPAIRAVAVLPVPGPGEEISLVAHVEAGEQGPEELDVEELLRWARARMPIYLAPSRAVLHRKLPRLASDKVDLGALADLGAAPPSPPESVVQEPATVLERGVAEIWAEVLDRPGIGRHQSFFFLGGHSLLAARVISRIRQRFGVDLPLRSLFLHPTVAAFTEQVQAAPSVEEVPVEALPDGPAPLSFAQARLWFLDQLEGPSGLYNVPLAFRLRGTLHRSALRRALRRVVERHDALRARVERESGEAVQRVVSVCDPEWRETDLCALPGARREAELVALLPRLGHRPFDLARPPLLRCELVTLGEQDHVVLLTAHHIAVDGESAELLLRDLGLNYGEVLDTGRGPARPPVQYPRFAAEQRQRLTGRRLESLVSYWVGKLEGAPPLLALPTDRPRPPQRDHRGGSVRWQLDGDQTRRLRRVAEDRGATLFMLLLASWQAFLSRISGEDDVVVGAPVAGRQDALLEETIGLFVNPLPIRGKLSGAPRFEDVLAAVRETVVEALEHQELPFERLVDSLQVGRSLDRSPLFQTMLTLEEGQRGELHLSGLRSQPIVFPLGFSKFDLALTARAVDSLDLELEFARDLFDETTARRWARSFERLLTAFAECPALGVRDAPLLDPAELHEQRVEWGGAQDTDPGRSRLHDLFAGAVARCPESVAVVEGAHRWTFGCLDRWSDRLAGRLRAGGVGPETVVAVGMERSAALVVAVLAVFKAGGVYLPLDPAHPTERLRTILDDACPAVLLTDERWGASIPDLGVPRLDPRALGDAVPAPPPRGGCGGGAAAYLLYTSGSTGRPKGVMVPHAGICNRVAWSLGLSPVSEDDALLQVAAVGFDISLWEIFFPLAVGARLVVAPGEVSRDPAALAAEMARHRVTVLHLIPSLLEPLLSQEELSPRGPLRMVVSGGETLPPSAVELLGRRLPAVRLCHAYGPTEASISVTHWEPSHGGLTDRVPLGRSIGNVGIEVLDRRMESVPLGVSGEICIRGAALARGYWKSPAHTAERFVPDPGGVGARVYRTGDRGRLRADGLLDFLGRIDHQVKIRGHRVEPGEVEAALIEHPAVHQAVVICRTGSVGGPRLAAYVLPAGREHSVGEREIRQFLGERLPSAMVPDTVTWLDAMPLLPTGKVDRAALPEPAAVADRRSRKALAPRTELEERLAAVWREVLGISEVGVEDNFFEIGGDSILSIHLSARMRDLGLQVSVKDVFRAPTIAGLAARAIESARPEPGDADVSSVGELPLTPIQKRFFDLALPSWQHFHQALLLDATGIDPNVLIAALERVVRRHEALRLRFHLRQGVPHQELAPEDDAPGPRLPVIDLGALRGSRREGALERAGAQAKGAVDPSISPLTAVLFELGADSGRRLLLAIHHLVVDAVSWPVILAELEGGWRLAPAERPPSSGTLGRWMRELAQRTADGAFDSELDHWTSVLAAPRLRLSPDSPAGPNLESCAGRRTVVLPAEATARLARVLPRQFRAGMLEAVTTALALSLAEVGTEPPVVMMEGHGRHGLSGAPDIGRTVGWFTTVFPVRLEVDRDGSPATNLERVKEALRSVPGGGLGYGALRHLRQGDGADRLRRMPEPQVGLNFLGRWGDPTGGADRLRMASEAHGPDFAPGNRRERLLDVDARIAGDCLEATWTFSRQQWSSGTVSRLAERFLHHLQVLVDGCCRGDAFGYTPSDFPLAGLDQTTLDRLFGDIPGVEDVYPLSPMQGGFLFSALSRPDSRAYFTQIVLDLEGELDEAALRRAWISVVDHHTALRSGFVWEGVDEPLQFVLRGAPLAWERRDWQDLDEDEARSKLEHLLEVDRRRGYDLGSPPLMRLCFLDRGPGHSWLVWSHHHILVDGWSLPLVLGDMRRAYEEIVGGAAPTLRAVRPFREYIEWIRTRDRTAAESFWGDYLGGLGQPTLLAPDTGEAGRVVPAESHGTVGLTINGDRGAALRQMARRHGLTLGAVFQGAWALLLARLLGRHEVVLGISVSGRPSELPGVEGMVGLFINTLPLRVRLSDEEDLVSFLRRVQAETARIQEHAHLPLNRIQARSPLPRGQSLFDHILVFENYPTNGTDAGGSLRLRNIEALETTEYPLTLTVMPGESVRIEMTYVRERLAPARVESLARYLENVLDAIAGTARGSTS